MLYHYTSISAMTSILQDVRTMGTMCFWATRYDCFADTEEFKLGVDTVRRLMPEVEKDMPSDRQIASMFDWNVIKDNQNLPYPYIVSFSSRPDNDYMWYEYAKEDGVVLEIDDSERVEVPDTPLLRLASCIYIDGNSDDKLIEMLRYEYNEVGLRMLDGPQKTLAFALLKDYPQVFVKLIATGLLFVTAPRIKCVKYNLEEETRVIIPLPAPIYNTLIDGYDEIISNLGFNPTELRTLVANERSRQRTDVSTVFYREMHLPIYLLKGVWVKKEAARAEVERFLAESGLNIPLRKV